jgi:hypothetical protein
MLHIDMSQRLAALVDTSPVSRSSYPRNLVSMFIEMGGVSWRQFFVDCVLKDVLDFVTVAYWYLTTKRGTGIIEHDPCSFVP